VRGTVVLGALDHDTPRHRSIACSDRSCTDQASTCCPFFYDLSELSANIWICLTAVAGVALALVPSLRKEQRPSLVASQAQVVEG
jgi:hypothetical protein